MIGAYPGSFNPPTRAHLAIAEAAREAFGLSRVDLVVSRRALDKEHVDRPLFEHRLDVLHQVASSRPWLGVTVTDAQLLVDMTGGYDVLIVGADKYHQLFDTRYYGGSDAARDEAVARLPRLAVAPRPPLEVPDELVLVVDPRHATASSTAARRGAAELMVREASRFDRRTGAWTDPARYERWLAGGEQGRPRRGGPGPRPPGGDGHQPEVEPD